MSLPRIALFCAWVLATAFIEGAFAVEPLANPRNPSGVFSNMTYDEESGDLDGFEFFFVYSKSGYYVFYQYGNGAPETPILTPLNIKDNAFEFSIPIGGEFYGRFVGEYTATGVQGRFEDFPLKLIKLTRGKSYWQH